MKELISALEAIRSGLTTVQSDVERSTKQRAYEALVEYEKAVAEIKGDGE